MRSIRIRLAEFMAAGTLLVTACSAQTDPGPRGGAPAVGGPIPGLASELVAVFQRVGQVSGGGNSFKWSGASIQFGPVLLLSRTPRRRRQ